ncbi:S-adenosylmethionine decarboxylase [archaeon]|nr:S-adenosylmethionine decarboxylase [archaeon]|tara:strand:- start:884 stop:1243 length:360 start_codon:yes stop_codon:yes gene_type:complete
MVSKNWWGRSASIDLHNCKIELLKDPKIIKKFIKDLCKILKMKRRGPTRIDRFGQGRLKGWSIMQFIDTSTIVAHFDEKGGRAFIDIFSCKRFNTKIIANFSKKFFEAKTISLYVKERL